MDTAVHQLHTFNMLACIVTSMVHLKKNHITADESNICQHTSSNITCMSSLGEKNSGIELIIKKLARD